jgi:membrane-associated phospholipid phosphatase
VIGWLRRRRAHVSARRLVLLLLGGFGALFCAVKADRSAAIDLAITLKLQQRRTPALATVMGAASWPGFPPQSRVIPALIIAAWWVRRRRLAALTLVAAWGTALLSTLVKLGVRRSRPAAPQVEVVVAPLGGTSFPSGHVLTFVGFYGCLAYLLAVELDDGPMRSAAIAFLSGLVAIVGPSRIQQGHHWPTDVLASYLLGSAYLLVLVEAYGRLSGVDKGPLERLVRHRRG